MKKIRLLLIMIAIAGKLHAATNYFISTTGSNSNPGTASLPFLTIQKGVDMANAGDTIIVKDGTYGTLSIDTNSFAVNINKAGNSSDWFTLKAEHNLGAILDCQHNNHSYIYLNNNAAYWIIEGFDIRNGYSGGIWSNSNGGQNIIIRHNHIHNIGNRVDLTPYGIAGIYTNNNAQNFVIDGNVINDVGRTNTYTSGYDHGIYTHGQNFTITNNVFYKSLNGYHIQTAVGFFGLIANNTFYGPNMYAGPNYDGQIMLWDVAGGNVTIQNNIFYNSIGTALANFAFSCPVCTITDNIIYGSGVTLGAPSGAVTSSNMLNTNPMFTDTSTFNFHLNFGSPAIDVGLTISSITTDFDGNTRPQGAGFDIGAFEFVTPSGINNLTSNHFITVFPNPSNGEFTIEGTNAKDIIYIYNFLGERIYTKKLSSEKAEINLRNHAHGFYFYQVSSEDKFIAAGKFVIQ